MQETRDTQVRSLGWEDPQEEGVATHSSILAWSIPRTEETGRLQSMGSQSDMTEMTRHSCRLGSLGFHCVPSAVCPRGIIKSPML